MSFFIRFPSCGILPDMGKARFFSSISHSIRKDRKTHRMGKAWEIGSWESPAKSIVCGEPGKLVLRFFPLHGYSFPIRFTSYGKLYNMWITWVSPSISHSIGKCSKIHPIRTACKIGTRCFPNAWAFCSIRFPSYGILYHMGNTWLFSSISNSTGENASKQPFETSSCFSIVLLFVLVPKSGDSLKEQTGKTDKVKLLF